MRRAESSGIAARSRMRLACWVAVVLVVSALFVLGRTPYAVGLVPHPWDKLLHLVVFTLLTLLLYRAFGMRGARLAVLVALGVAIADEGHQWFLPGRNSDLADMVADAAGVALGAFVLRQLGKE